MYVYFIADQDQLRFVSSRENYELFDDRPYILRLFVQKYGGSWQTYEELRDQIREGKCRLYKYHTNEFRDEVMVHDDRRWIKEIPPLGELVSHGSA